MSIKSLQGCRTAYDTRKYAEYYDWMNRRVLSRFLKVVTEEAVRMSDGKQFRMDRRRKMPGIFFFDSPSMVGRHI